MRRRASVFQSSSSGDRRARRESLKGRSRSDPREGAENDRDERNAVALEYLTAFDNAGVRPGGGSILDLFAEDAQVYFPKWGVATGKTEIGRMFGDVGATIRSILHDYDTFNYVMTGSDVFAVEGTSSGEHRGGPRQAGTSHSGRWCDIFEVRDNLIHRCFLYLDPDYAGKDTERYPRLSENGRDAARPIA